MNKTLRKILTASSALLMIADVGATVGNSNVNAKRRHARTHWVYRHHAKHHQRIAKHSRKKYNASMFFEYKMGDVNDNITPAKNETVIKPLRNDAIDRGGKYVGMAQNGIKVLKTALKPIKSLPSQSKKFPHTRQYYSELGSKIDSLFAGGPTPYGSEYGNGHPTANDYIREIKTYAPMSFNRDFQNGFYKHHNARLVKHDIQYASNLDDMGTGGYNWNNVTSRQRKSFVKTRTKFAYYNGKDSLLELQHYVSNHNKLYRTSFLDGACQDYNQGGFNRYKKYGDHGVYSKHYIGIYEHGWFDGDLFSSGISSDDNNDEFVGPNEEVSDNYVNQPATKMFY